MNRGEANIPINLTKVHAIILFNEEIHYLLLRSYRSVTSINHLVNITRVAREPELLLAFYSIMMPRAVFFLRGIDSFVSHDDMESAMMIII